MSLIHQIKVENITLDDLESQVMKPGLYEMVVNRVEDTESNNARNEGIGPDQIHIVLETDEPVKDTKNKTIAPGFVVHDWTLLVERGKLTGEQIAKEVARRAAAILGKPDAEWPDYEELVGRPVKVRIGTRTMTDGRQTNTILNWVPKKED